MLLKNLNTDLHSNTFRRQVVNSAERVDCNLNSGAGLYQF